MIKDVSLIRESDIDGKGFPSPELRVRILNKGLYDQLDSSTYAPYFQKRQRFEYTHSLKLPDGSMEGVYCGTFFLTDWSVSDTIVEFIASGRPDLQLETTYFGSSFQEFTIAQLVNRIVPGSNITVNSPPVTGYFGNVGYRRLLAMLSELSCCLVYEDRDNIVQFADIIPSLSAEGRNEWNYRLDGSWLLGEKPFLSALSSVDEINRRNMFPRHSVHQKEYYNAINLAEYAISTEHRQISKTEHQPGEITIYFGNPVIGEPLVEVSQGFSLENIIIYTMYMTAVLLGEGTAEVTVSGDIATLNKSEVLYKAPWHTGREPDSPYNVDLPCMIKGGGFPAFRDWFLERRFAILNMRLSTDIRWVQNPEREIGDLVNVQLRDGQSNADMIITRQEIRYPALKGDTRLISNIDMR